MIVDFHTHTYNSYDCRMKPLKILKIARERHIDAIVINDHNTIKGGLEAKKLNPYDDLEVIVGAEIKTDIGDITGIFLKEEITSYHYADVIQEIKNQGGISILNHPYQGHNLSDMNFDGIDLIEGYNSRLNKELNNKAIQLAKELSKPYIAGSDSHLYSDIGRSTTEILSGDYFNPISTTNKRNSFFSTLISQYIKAHKKNDFKLGLNLTLGIPKYCLNRMIKG